MEKPVFLFMGVILYFGAKGQQRNTQAPIPSMQVPSVQSPIYKQPGQVQLGATAESLKRLQQQAAVPPSYTQKCREIEAMAREMAADKQRWPLLDQQRATASTGHLVRFEQALKLLTNMLSGKTRLSVADAYYTTEATLGNSYLTQPAYAKIISESVSFIKKWMQQNGLDIRDNYMVHYAIQKFMSEPLTVYGTAADGEYGSRTTSTTHRPFRYDYEDYQGIKDYRNLFVTKCLATGYGQCSSLPGVYLVLAEALGVKAYLTTAPYHSFIKYPDNKGYILNYEPTSNWQISDSWYKDNMFISAKAIETGIYLDTLGSRQIIANCIYDLAVNYAIVDRTGNESFILDCLKAAAPYFPKQNNLQAYFITALHLKTLLRETMGRKNIVSLDNLGQHPDALKLYQAYMNNEAKIASLGYQETPAELYEEMLNSQEFKGRLQKELKANSKEKRNLFAEIK